MRRKAIEGAYVATASAAATAERRTPHAGRRRGTEAMLCNAAHLRRVGCLLAPPRSKPCRRRPRRRAAATAAAALSWCPPAFTCAAKTGSLFRSDRRQRFASASHPRRAHGGPKKTLAASSSSPPRDATLEEKARRSAARAWHLGANSSDAQLRLNAALRRPRKRNNKKPSHSAKARRAAAPLLSR